MQALGYLRVSTDRQAESGLGIEAQRAAITKYVKEHKLTDLQWFCDEVSGADGLDKRPQLAAALRAFPLHGVLVIAKMDRLARDKQMFAYIEMKVASKFGRIASCAGEGTNDDSPAGALLQTITQGFAVYERQLIQARTKAAHAAIRARGYFPGKDPPYGFRKNPRTRKLEPDAKEAAAVALAKHLRAEGLSWNAVGDKLLAEGFKPRKGPKWHATQVRRMVG